MLSLIFVSSLFEHEKIINIDKTIKDLIIIYLLDKKRKIEKR